MLQGKFEEAEAQRTINDLKNQGIIIDQKEIDAINQKKKALKDAQLSLSIKDEAQTIFNSLNGNGIY